MKKTGTTIFTLGLAMILVGSLSSGVLLAKGRNVEVVILDCGFDDFLVLNPGTLAVTGLNRNTDDDFGITVIGTPNNGGFATPTECVEAIAVILKARFKMQNSSGGFHPDLMIAGSEALYSRYTFVRNRRGPRDD